VHDILNSGLIVRTFESSVEKVGGYPPNKRLARGVLLLSSFSCLKRKRRSLDQQLLPLAGCGGLSLPAVRVCVSACEETFERLSFDSIESFIDKQLSEEQMVASKTISPWIIYECESAGAKRRKLKTVAATCSIIYAAYTHI
jgi:hypothetical protein